MSDRSRYECPRCGAGVKPTDHQCHRCGEILDRTPAMRDGSLSKSCSLKSMTKDGFYISKYGSIDLEERREELEEYGRALRKRDAELREHEARIERVYRQMEEDAAALEEAMDEMEERERALERSVPARTVEVAECGTADERAPLDIDSIVEEVMGRVDESVRAPVEDISRMATGDKRLDSLLGGGIPKGHLVMIYGAMGTMKTSLAMLISSRLTGRKVVYMSLDQGVDSLWRHADCLGIGLDRDLVTIQDMDVVRYGTESDEGDWRELVMSSIESMMPFDVLVMDSLDAYRAIVGESLDRRALRSLFDRISDMGVTTLLLAGNRRYDADDIYLADGAVEMEMREINGMRVQRWMRCVKMRGNDMDPRYHSFTIEDGRIRLSIPMAHDQAYIE